MQRIVIIGCSGSGKSRLARALSDRLGIGVTHLDALYFQPGWKDHPDRAAFDAQIREIASGERWIIDGGFTAGNVETRFARADTLVLMDFPTWLCLGRALWRVVTDWNKRRADLAPGCYERFDLEFLRFIWTYRARQLPALERDVSAHFRGELIRLGTPREVDGFLASPPYHAPI